MLCAIPIPGIGEIKPGDPLVETFLAALSAHRMELLRGDILVVTHKVVSKAEGQIVPLESVRTSPGARRWARQHHLDARVVELAMSEARRVVRRRHGVTITETRHGFVCANSGVDLSNVDGGHSAVLLPRDPDLSAQRLARKLKAHLGFAVPVIITDTFGRPWREGLLEFAIGVAGLKVFRDDRSRKDPYGYELRVSLEAVADELACMAGLACGKLARVPACIIRGFEWETGTGSGKQLLRDRKKDIFR